MDIFLVGAAGAAGFALVWLLPGRKPARPTPRENGTGTDVSAPQPLETSAWQEFNREGTQRRDRNPPT
jgi:hypothetical protein